MTTNLNENGKHVFLLPVLLIPVHQEFGDGKLHHHLPQLLVQQVRQYLGELDPHRLAQCRL
jgi:hypothetical protein